MKKHIFSSSILGLLLASPLGSSAQDSQLRFIYGINVGAADSAEFNGYVFSPDQFNTGGETNSTTDPISAASDDSLFQSERYGDIQYNIPVKNGRYTVILHHVEMYQTSAGERVFNASVEGRRIYNDLDLFSLVGHDVAFEYVIEDLEVNDGELNISFESVVDNAQLSGISIFSDDDGQVLD